MSARRPLAAAIAALRAAEDLLREHDARIAAAAAELKQLKQDREPLSERVRQCIDVLCGRATPDLFAPPPPEAPETFEVTPPLAPGEWVELETVRAARLADVAAVAAVPVLRGVAGYFYDAHEVETVGDLWDWLTADFAAQGGMSRTGLAYAVAYLVTQDATYQGLAAYAERFAAVLFDWLAANGHEPITPADPPHPKGERIDTLGVKLEDLEAATSLAGADYGKPKPKAGK